MNLVLGSNGWHVASKNERHYKAAAARNQAGGLIQFEFALAINAKRANRIAVAARRADTEIGWGTGSVYSYVYDRAAGFWNLDQILLPGDLLQDDEFGQSLAMDPFQGAWRCMGADQSALAGPEKPGALYAYTRENDQP